MTQPAPSLSISEVKGHDLDIENFELDQFLDGLISIGGQATLVGQAREIFADLIKLRKSANPSERPVVYLGYTSNMVTSGLRDIIRLLCENKLVDAVVTTGGGIEEDFMKCMRDFYVNYEYVVDDKKWRKEGINRTGNMAVPNDNYVIFEEWFSKQHTLMLEEQEKNGKIFGPSDIVRFLAEKIDNPESIYYWCARNGIEVFCPGITDGSLGDILYCKGFSEPALIVDVNKDLQKIMTLGLDKQRPLAAIIIGTGLVKYHILNACKIAGGLDMGIIISVGNEFDNSCSGAKPQQDMTRNAIKKEAKIVNINFDASIVVPLIVANQF